MQDTPKNAQNTRAREISKFARWYGISRSVAAELFGLYSRKPIAYRRLVEINSNAKVAKGTTQGYLSGILHLAPANLSGYEVCAWSTEPCRYLCLHRSGLGEVYTSIERARIAKTKLYFEDRALFLACLYHDAFRLMRKGARDRKRVCLRPNGTSDLVDIAHRVAEAFPMLTIYDYTKRPRPELYVKVNYDLTFSYSGENKNDCLNALARGINVTVVFSGIKPNQPLPATFWGYPVLDGDQTDLRFLDPRGHIVGLRPKGSRAKSDKGTSKFIVPAGQLIQIAA